MPCTPFRSSDGRVSGWICSRGSMSKPCKSCGRRSTKLCDYKLSGSKSGKTCDVPICDRCATSVGKNLDLCPVHARMQKENTP
jgi:hypothetical protein